MQIFGSVFIGFLVAPTQHYTATLSSAVLRLRLFAPHNQTGPSMAKPAYGGYRIKRYGLLCSFPNLGPDTNVTNDLNSKKIDNFH